MDLSDYIFNTGGKVITQHNGHDTIISLDDMDDWVSFFGVGDDDEDEDEDLEEDINNRLMSDFNDILTPRDFKTPLSLFISRPSNASKDMFLNTGFDINHDAKPIVVLPL